MWLKVSPDSSFIRDTLFKEDFSLREVQQRFSEVQAKCGDGCLILSYPCRDEGTRFVLRFVLWSRFVALIHAVSAETQKYGILEVDGDLRVVCMKEKPLPSETESRRAVSSPGWSPEQIPDQVYTENTKSAQTVRTLSHCSRCCLPAVSSSADFVLIKLFINQNVRLIEEMAAVTSGSCNLCTLTDKSGGRSTQVHSV